MGGLVFGVVKIAFLVLLWLFIGLIGNIIRTDLFGRHSVTRESDAAAQPNPKRRGRRVDQVAQLVVIAGKGAGDSVPLKGEITLGRAADATLDIADDYASSHHARIYPDDEGWVVDDLGSTNGTFVNGQKIARPTRIGTEDIIRIGRTQLKLER